mgnify:FL=1|jgi:hypothetical protein|nr:MAG TPA: Putative amidoligase enzyme [Caudoviricetes sp.]
MRIHYNVTGAERKRLVNAIVDTIGAKANYKGMPSAAYEIDYFTVTKDGTLEFSDRSDTEEVEMVIMALEAAGFGGIGETVEEPEEAQETSKEGGTKPTERQSSDAVELTVTLPMTRHTGMTIRNLTNLIYTRAGLLNKALGTAFRMDEGLVKALQDDACVLTLDRLFETVEAYENRYGKAANGIIIEPDKLTFSTLPETDDPAVLRTFTTLCAMMNKQALTQRRIQAKEITEENEKYAMRVWLLRLGMNGPEYKEERRILMRSLSGHCAFRTEEDKARWTQRQNEKRDDLRAAKQADTAMEVTSDEVSE